MATNGVLLRNAENPETIKIILPKKPRYVVVFLKNRSKSQSIISVFRIISPMSKSKMITAICSLAIPLKISLGVNIPKNPRIIIAIKKVNAGPMISVYRETTINTNTMETINISNGYKMLLKNKTFILYFSNTVLTIIDKIKGNSIKITKFARQN